MNTKPLRHLQIKKGLDWELWLVTHSKQTKIGSYTNLEELNQVQITLYQVWEKSRYPLIPNPGLTRQ